VDRDGACNLTALSRRPPNLLSSPHRSESPPNHWKHGANSFLKFADYFGEFAMLDSESKYRAFLLFRESATGSKHVSSQDRQPACRRLGFCLTAPKQVQKTGKGAPKSLIPGIWAYISNVFNELESALECINV
jgi:hypothetical protein